MLIINIKHIKMTTIISGVILILFLICISFINGKWIKELENRILELEVKNSQLKQLMSNILDIYSKNGQQRTESECSDLQGRTEPKDTSSTDPQKGSDYRQNV